MMKEPVCPKKEQVFNHHGIERKDPYFWLRERDAPEVLQYIEQENDYLKAGLAHTETLQQDLFAEMKGRIQETDQSVPYFKNGYVYYTRYEEGQDYPIYCRKLGDENAPEEILLDVNALAKGKEYCQVGGMSISPNNRYLVYGVDFVSRRQYTLHLMDLETGQIADWTAENTTGSVAWANDNETLFFTSKDDATLRSDTIWRCKPFQDSKEPVFHEKDEAFYSFCYRSKTGKFILIGSESSTTSEYSVISCDAPEQNPQVFTPRQKGVEYSIDHDGDRFLILSNAFDCFNFALYEAIAPGCSMADWKVVVEHQASTLLEDVDVFEQRIILLQRVEGTQSFLVLDKTDASKSLIPIEEAAASLHFGTNPEYTSTHFRYGLTSLKVPNSVMHYDFNKNQTTVLKEQAVLGGFAKEDYESERLEITVRDGEKVPVSLVYHKNHKPSKNSPLLLYGYGSYGYSMDTYFSSNRLSLLDRGFTFAIAHIRGGEDKGRKWYENGKMLNKKNTFHDFIDCGKGLIDLNYTSSQKLYAMGGSAGGLLMGAVMNMAPQLFNGIVASVPFVDVINTMLDETIPLTTGEYEEWGNPNDPDYFKYILSYSPYDNIQETDYPHLLITTGYHDSQVQYWEPAKWIARLRSLRTNTNSLYLYTNMEAGHGGASGRFSALKEVALEYAFLLDLEKE